jgi:hypothetical protein
MGKIIAAFKAVDSSSLAAVGSAMVSGSAAVLRVEAKLRVKS